MSEREVRVRVDDDVELEGRFDEAEGPAAAVLCHPHPLYGGSMENNVVLAARDALVGLGIGTLRFDFRGVGRSTGSFGGGVGEAEDVEAAFRFLADAGRGPLFLVGYSFGAWVGLRAVDRGLDPDALALVSPPVTFLDFEPLGIPDRPCLIVVGDGDDYCAIDDLEEWLEAQPGEPAPLDRVLVEDTDHFYWGAESVMAEAVADFFRARL